MTNPSETGVVPFAESPAQYERLLAELERVVERTLSSTSRRSKLRPVAGTVSEIPFQIDGQEHAARLFKLSWHGAKLATDHKPPVGSLIRIGRVSARVVDHFQNGVAIEFVDIEDQEPD
jgi:hypothetical protein